jgi:hypothetical protein
MPGKLGHTRHRVREKPGNYTPVGDENKRQKVQAQQAAYLASLAQDGTLSGGCTAAHCSAHTVYLWREQDPTFVVREYEAREQFADMIEREMVRRGVHGYKKPVYQGGELVGHVQEYSDSLLQKLAGAARPQKFRERLDVNSAQTIVVRVVSSRIDADAIV